MSAPDSDVSRADVLDQNGVPLAINDVVQIDPAHDERFGACLMIVSGLKASWRGIQGYVKIPADGDAYYRCEGVKVLRIGPAWWSHTKAAGRSMNGEGQR